MRRFTAVLVLFTLVLSSASCSSNRNKKITPPEAQLPNVEYKDSSQNDPPSQNVSKNDTEKTNQDNSSQKNTEPPVQDNTKQSEQDKYNYQNNSSNDVPGAIQMPQGLSSENITSWQRGNVPDHKVPIIQSKFTTILDKYEGYYVGDTSSKVIYLTFDEGYEGDYTAKILDTLKNNDVRATFFVVKSYIKDQPEIVKRMVQEGHIVGNHTKSHPNMPLLYANKGAQGVIKELTETADYFKEVTGYDMPKFYRPPEGAWSEATLYITNALGYKTILWSMAHRDWDVNNQPPAGAAYKYVDTYYHNGAILLLHPQSKTNVDDLDAIIKNIKSKGYRFAPLTELHK
jgi:peptidoglycan-N-acetylmuramic acid deacetylase